MEPLVLGEQRRATGVDRAGDDPVEVDPAGRELELAAADERAVEQIVDQARQMGRLALEDVAGLRVDASWRAEKVRRWSSSWKTTACRIKASSDTAPNFSSATVKIPKLE